MNLLQLKKVMATETKSKIFIYLYFKLCQYCDNQTVNHDIKVFWDSFITTYTKMIDCYYFFGQLGTYRQPFLYQCLPPRKLVNLKGLIRSLPKIDMKYPALPALLSAQGPTVRQLQPPGPYNTVYVAFIYIFTNSPAAGRRGTARGY